MAKNHLSRTAGRDMRAYVEAHLGGTLRYQTIDSLCGTTSSNEVYGKIIGPLVKDGVLTVSRPKLIRGNDECPIYEEYLICDELPHELLHSGAFMLGTANAGTVSDELALLNPALTAGDFLALNLKATIAWIDELRMLSSWLDDPANADAEPALPEERAFEVFHNEKVLNPHGENREGRTLLELVSNTDAYERLHLRRQASSELPYYAPHKHLGAGPLTILIVENHAPFVRACDLLESGERRLFGKRVDGVVYGSGFAVLAEDALATTERLFAHGKAVKYLYWGDIDRPGIEVYERLAEVSEVQLLTAAYEVMLDAADIEQLPRSGGQQLPKHLGIDLAERLNRARLEKYLHVIARDLRIPQEAVPVGAYVEPGMVEEAVARVAERVHAPKTLPQLPEALRHMPQRALHRVRKP